MYFNSIDIVNERDFLLDEDWAEIEAEKNTACHVIIKILLGLMTFWNPGRRSFSKFRLSLRLMKWYNYKNTFCFSPKK